MFTVKKKPLTPNVIWDAENNKPLCRFDRSGQLETEDAALANKLKKLGHEVTEAENSGLERQEQTNEADTALKESQAKAAQTGRKNRKDGSKNV